MDLSERALTILLRTGMSPAAGLVFQQAVDEISQLGVVQLLSSPGAGPNSERFGAGASANGASASAFGNGAAADFDDSLAYGRDAAAEGPNDGQWGAAARPVDFRSYRQLALGYASVAADTDTVATPQAIIGVTDTTAPRTVTLQTATLKAGRSITINDESGGAGTNNITIDTEGSETIDGAATAVIDQDNGAIQLYSDGNNWFTAAAAAAAGNPFAGFTQGSVAFVGAGSVAAEDNANLFWDDTNNRLGIGTATPAVKLHVIETTSVAAASFVNASSATNLLASVQSQALLFNTNQTAGNYGSMQFITNNSTGNPRTFAHIAAVYTDHTADSEDADFCIISMRDGSLTEQMRITSSGNVGIGTTSPEAKIDSTGTIRATGFLVPSSGTGTEMLFNGGIDVGLVIALDRGTSAIKAMHLGGNGTFGLRVDETGNVGIGTTVPADALDVVGAARLSTGLGVFGSTPPGSQPAAIADASGGATVDAEARTATNALLAVMRANGLIDT